MTIHEVTFKFDSESMRHKALAVLFDEIRNLELLHNEADKRAETAEARIAAALAFRVSYDKTPSAEYRRGAEDTLQAFRRALTEGTGQ